MLKSVYEQVKAHLLAKRKHWVDKLPSNFGFAVGAPDQTGILIREKQFVLNGNCSEKIEPGQAYLLSLGVKDLRTKQDQPYAFLLADTVLVHEDAPKPLTDACSKRFDWLRRVTKPPLDRQSDSPAAPMP